MSDLEQLLAAVKFDEKGLVPAIAQDKLGGRILMVAYMNREALSLTFTTGTVTYFSRSRNKLWKKGEESGHVQEVREIRIDCDGDVVLLLVKQHGPGACHTGHRSCFFRRKKGDRWVEADPLSFDPKAAYTS